MKEGTNDTHLGCLACFTQEEIKNQRIKDHTATNDRAVTQTSDFRLRIQVLSTLHIKKHSGKLPQNKTHHFLSNKLHLAYEKHT